MIEISLQGNHVTSDGENISQIANVELSEGEWATDCFCISTGNDASNGSSIPLGHYLLFWKR